MVFTMLRSSMTASLVFGLLFLVTISELFPGNVCAAPAEPVTVSVYHYTGYRQNSFCSLESPSDSYTAHPIRDTQGACTNHTSQNSFVSLDIATRTLHYQCTEANCTGCLFSGSYKDDTCIALSRGGSIAIVPEAAPMSRLQVAAISKILPASYYVKSWYGRCTTEGPGPLFDVDVSFLGQLDGCNQTIPNNITTDYLTIAQNGTTFVQYTACDPNCNLHTGTCVPNLEFVPGVCVEAQARSGNVTMIASYVVVNSTSIRATIAPELVATIGRVSNKTYLANLTSATWDNEIASIQIFLTVAVTVPAAVILLAWITWVGCHWRKSSRSSDDASTHLLAADHSTANHQHVTVNACSSLRDSLYLCAPFVAVLVLVLAHMCSVNSRKSFFRDFYDRTLQVISIPPTLLNFKPLAECFDLMARTLVIASILITIITVMAIVLTALYAWTHIIRPARTNLTHFGKPLMIAAVLPLGLTVWIYVVAPFLCDPSRYVHFVPPESTADALSDPENRAILEHLVQLMFGGAISSYMSVWIVLLAWSFPVGTCIGYVLAVNLMYSESPNAVVELNKSRGLLTLFLYSACLLSPLVVLFPVIALWHLMGMWVFYCYAALVFWNFIVALVLSRLWCIYDSRASQRVAVFFLLSGVVSNIAFDFVFVSGAKNYLKLEPSSILTLLFLFTATTTSAVVACSTFLVEQELNGHLSTEPRDGNPLQQAASSPGGTNNGGGSVPSTGSQIGNPPQQAASPPGGKNKGDDPRNHPDPCCPGVEWCTSGSKFWKSFDDFSHYIWEEEERKNPQMYSFRTPRRIWLCFGTPLLWWKLVAAYQAAQVPDHTVLTDTANSYMEPVLGFTWPDDPQIYNSTTFRPVLASYSKGRDMSVDALLAGAITFTVATVLSLPRGQTKNWQFCFHASMLLSLIGLAILGLSFVFPVLPDYASKSGIREAFPKCAPDFGDFFQKLLTTAASTIQTAVFSRMMLPLLLAIPTALFRVAGYVRLDGHTLFHQERYRSQAVFVGNVVYTIGAISSPLLTAVPVVFMYQLVPDEAMITKLGLPVLMFLIILWWTLSLVDALLILPIRKPGPWKNAAYWLTYGAPLLSIFLYFICTVESFRQSVGEFVSHAGNVVDLVRDVLCEWMLANVVIQDVITLSGALNLLNSADGSHMDGS